MNVRNSRLPLKYSSPNRDTVYKRRLQGWSATAPRNDRRIIHSRGGDDSPSPEWWVPDGPFAILASYVLMSGVPFVGRGTRRPAVNNPWMGWTGGRRKRGMMFD